MQIHTPTDQLLPPLEGDETERGDLAEVWDCFMSPSAYGATEDMRVLCSALQTLSPPLTDESVQVPQRKPSSQQGRPSVSWESSAIHPVDRGLRRCGHTRGHPEVIMCSIAALLQPAWSEPTVSKMVIWRWWYQWLCSMYYTDADIFVMSHCLCMSMFPKVWISVFTLK